MNVSSGDKNFGHDSSLVSCTGNMFAPFLIVFGDVLQACDLELPSCYIEKSGGYVWCFMALQSLYLQY